ncbi:MAG: hypothetical protein K6E77_03580 [Lachnospiraceae bacterium]|nr:hypothetical protein [Lachnospiraceae bacterium]
MIDFDVADIAGLDTTFEGDVFPVLFSAVSDIADFDPASEGEAQPVIMPDIVNMKSIMHASPNACIKRIGFFILKP